MWKIKFYSRFGILNPRNYNLNSALNYNDEGTGAFKLNHKTYKYPAFHCFVRMHPQSFQIKFIFYVVKRLFCHVFCPVYIQNIFRIFTVIGQDNKGSCQFQLFPDEILFPVLEALQKHMFRYAYQCGFEAALKKKVESASTSL